VKKLSIIFLSVAFTGGVALACPHDDASKAEAAPKTAEKAKEADKAKAKEADKAKTAKPAEKKPAEKKPADKVSQK
jgi:hypothetical protein